MPDATPLEAALSYAREGWPVLPLFGIHDGSCNCHKRAACHSPGKHPRTANGFKDATTDETIIGRWFERWPVSNLGLAVPDGYAVVDVDGEAGWMALDACDWHLPETATVRTGHGEHRYYSTDQCIAPKVGILPNVDLRGPGSYVVLPPSRHINGMIYEWRSDLGRIAVAPDWVGRAAGEKRNTTPTGTADGLIPEGERNATLTSMAGVMRRKGFTRAAIESALLAENAGRCAPQLDEDEVRRIAASVSRYAPVDPPDLTSSSSSPKHSDDDDESAERRPAGSLVTLATLKTRYSGEVAYLVYRYIAFKELTEVVGGPEVMKSWAMADLARAVLTDGLWLGHFPVEPGGVIYVEQERANNLVYQTKLLEAAHECALDHLLVLPPGSFTLNDESARRQLRLAIEEHQPKLVIVNSFRSVFRGRAADGVAIADQVGWLGRLAERYGCAVVLIDQVNKGGASGHTRGLQAHADSLQKEFEADAVLHIERDRDELGHGVGPSRLYIGKRRAGIAGPPFSFEVREIGGGAAPIWIEEISIEKPEHGDNADLKVMATLRQSPVTEFTPEQIAAILGLKLGTVKNVLTRLKNQGLAENTARGKWKWARSSSPASTSMTHDDDDQDQLELLPF